MQPSGKRLPSRRNAVASRKDVSGLTMSEWDRQNITRLINFFEKAYPGVIDYVVNDAKKDILPKTSWQSAKKSDFNLHRRAAMPEGLLAALKEGYPAIVTDRTQFEQFLKWFPRFDLWR